LTQEDKIRSKPKISEDRPGSQDISDADSDVLREAQSIDADDNRGTYSVKVQESQQGVRKWISSSRWHKLRHLEK
jgi:hypothetical protein